MSYELGERVTFADANATVSDGLPGIRTGTINGDPIRDAAGNIMAYKVWASRDNQREATTIIVMPTNMIGRVS